MHDIMHHSIGDSQYLSVSDELYNNTAAECGGFDGTAANAAIGLTMTGVEALPALSYS